MAFGQSAQILQVEHYKVNDAPFVCVLLAWKLGIPWHACQGWRDPAKPMALTPWSWHGQRLGQGFPDILLLELALCVTLPGICPGKIHHWWTIPWDDPGKFTRPVRP